MSIDRINDVYPFHFDENKPPITQQERDEIRATFKLAPTASGIRQTKTASRLVPIRRADIPLKIAAIAQIVDSLLSPQDGIALRCVSRSLRKNLGPLAKAGIERADALLAIRIRHMYYSKAATFTFPDRMYTPSAADEHSEPHFLAKYVRTLHLPYCQRDGQGDELRGILTHLATLFPNSTSVNSGNSEINEEYSVLSNLPNIEKLANRSHQLMTTEQANQLPQTLQQFDYPFTSLSYAVLSKIIEKCPYLTHFTMGWWSVGFPTAQIFELVSQLHQLQSLSLPRALENIAEGDIARLPPTIQELSCEFGFGANPVATTVQALKHLPTACPNITNLCLRINEMRDGEDPREGLSYTELFEIATRFQHLEKLNLRNSKPQPQSAFNIFEGTLPNLRSLTLDRCSSIYFSYSVNAHTCPNLRELTIMLRNNGVEEELVFFEALKQFPLLDTLNLSYSGLVGLAFEKLPPTVKALTLDQVPIAQENLMKLPSSLQYVSICTSPVLAADPLAVEEYPWGAKVTRQARQLIDEDLLQLPTGITTVRVSRELQISDSVSEQLRLRGIQVIMPITEEFGPNGYSKQNEPYRRQANV